MVKKISKKLIWGAYAVLIVILGVVGYFVGKKSGKPEIYASAGVVLGAVISIVLWLAWGKKNSK